MLQQPSEREFKDQASSETKPILERNDEEMGWPSFRQLVVDLSKISLEALTSLFLQFVPSYFRPDSTKRGLTPLKDRLRMPEDEMVPTLVKRQSAPAPLTESRQVHLTSGTEKYSETKTAKVKSSVPKDPSLPSKHRSSKRHEYAEFYGSSEIPPHTKSKSLKQRSKHRQREKSEQVLGAVGVEQKPPEMRAVDYANTKYDPYNYNMSTKYVPEDTSRFNPH